ncbi:MAG: hypothetical protein ACSLFL_02065 [Alphaproteobacteria bacterium]
MPLSLCSYFSWIKQLLTGPPDDSVIASGAKQSGNHAEKLLFFASGGGALALRVAAQLTMEASAIALAEYELLELILFRPIPRREVMQRAMNPSASTPLPRVRILK